MLRPSLSQALKWSIGSEIASKFIQPIVFIFLARLLIPADFGVVAAAMIIISFSQVFWEAGFGKAIVQRSGEISTAANIAFFMNVGLGLVTALVIFLAAGDIALIFFKDERVTQVIRVLIIHLILASLASVPIALLQRELKFQVLFWIRLAMVVPTILSIPLAIYGYGYWSLVAGTILGQISQVAILWRATSWRPRFVFDRAIMRDLSKFAGWASLSGLLAWFYLWADSLVVGAYLGAYDLGLYRTGNQLVSMIYGIAFAPILPVIYSYFSRRVEDAHDLAAPLSTGMRLITIVSVPFAFFLFCLAPLTPLILGRNWQDIEQTVAILVLAQGYAWIVALSGEAYRAIGRPSIEAAIMGVGFLVYLATYLVAIRYGLEIFLWARFCLTIFGIISHIIVVCSIFKLSTFHIIRTIFWATCMGLSLVFFIRSFHAFTPSYSGALALAALVVAAYQLARDAMRDNALRTIFADVKNKIA